MYTKDGAWATSATPLPMWGVDGSGMVPRPNMVSVSRDIQYEQEMLAESFLASNRMLMCIRHDQSRPLNDWTKDGVEVSFFLAGSRASHSESQLEQKDVGPEMASCTLP